MSGGSVRLRKDVINALRNGAVPEHGLHLYATGLERFEKVVGEELRDVVVGRSTFKAVRAPYGGGKTFFSRWLQDRALQEGFAVSEVQISASETPLYKLETVYRRAMEKLTTREQRGGAFRQIVDGWLYTLEEQLRGEGVIDEGASDGQVQRAVGQALDAKLRDLSQQAPQFAAVLRSYHQALVDGDEATAEGLIAWVSGSPTIGAAVKRKAGLKGEVDSRLALNFFHGLSLVLTFSGRKGLVLVLDEVETIQRQRNDTREQSLNGLRQLIDHTSDATLPNLYLLVTGTPEFYDSPWGVQRLEPLAQRLETHFAKDPSFDNVRAPQVRLLPFSAERLLEVGRKVRDLYPTDEPERLQRGCDEAVLDALVDRVLGVFRGEVGAAPRLYLKKLVDVLDRLHDYPDFDARAFLRDEFEVKVAELNEEERAAQGGVSLDALDLPMDG